jgi:hypothetical protein
MSNQPREMSNDTLLLINAINRQTEVLEQSLKRIEARLDSIERNKCINSQFNVMGCKLSLNTLVYLTLFMNIALICFIFKISPATVIGILSAL